jgi:integrase
MEWVRLNNGLEYRKHRTRKHGARFDRYIRGRYTVDGKTVTVSFGWESEWTAAERARMAEKNETGSRGTFTDYCTMEISLFKSNAKRGSGPTTLKQQRKKIEAKQKVKEDLEHEMAKKAVTFGEYFTKSYFPAAVISKKKSTTDQELSYFTNWLEPNIGRIGLVDIRPLHLEKVKRVMVKKEKAPRTIQAGLGLARHVWNHAKENDVVKGDWPCHSVNAGRFDNRRMRFLTHDECDRLLGKLRVSSPQVANIALLSLDTGMRTGEILSLIWENVDIDAGQIRVVDPKNGKNRISYLTDRTKTMLQVVQSRHGLVFPNKAGRRIKAVSKTAGRAISALGLNDGILDRRNKATFHSLRHTFASRLVANGTDLYTVKELMGHSTLAMTERYSHVSNESLELAVKRMEQATAKKAQADVIPLTVNGKE